LERGKEADKDLPIRETGPLFLAAGTGALLKPNLRTSATLAILKVTPLMIGLNIPLRIQKSFFSHLCSACGHSSTSETSNNDWGG
jgi:hypothetical protein